MNHKQPTQEELEANALKAAEEAEALKNNPPEDEEAKKAAEEAEAKKQEEEKQATEKKAAEEAEAKKIAEEEEKKKEDPDYKKKFKASAQEALILNAKLEEGKKVSGSIEEAAQATVTDEELKVIYPDWEDMTGTEQRLAKENAINTKRFDIMHKGVLATKDVEAWNKKVEDYVSDPKTLVDVPELEGKIEEFRIFASKPTRRNVDFETLVSSFLWVESKTMKVEKKKDKMFEEGGGGPADKGKQPSGKLSFDEGQALKKSDYGKYVQLLGEGKIEDFSG